MPPTLIFVVGGIVTALVATYVVLIAMASRIDEHPS
jgi:hypothetical protein